MGGWIINAEKKYFATMVVMEVVLINTVIKKGGTMPGHYGKKMKKPMGKKKKMDKKKNKTKMKASKR